MGWTSGIVVYVIAWWLVFFMILPVGVKPPHEAGHEAEPGHEPGAPVNPMLWRKALATTLIAGVLWGLTFWLIASDLISFRDG